MFPLVLARVLQHEQRLAHAPLARTLGVVPPRARRPAARLRAAPAAAAPLLHR